MESCTVGIDYEYRCGGRVHEWRPGAHDRDALRAIRKRLPADVDALTIRVLGKPEKIARRALLESAERVVTLLRTEPAALPSTYEFLVERELAPGVPPMWQVGSLSGFRLEDQPDRYFGIETGLDKCIWQTCRVGKDGRGEILSEEDIRDRQEIRTANLGLVQIRSTQASDLVEELDRLHAFLAGQSDDEVTKIAS